MRNRMPIMMLSLALIVSFISGCQNREVPPPISSSEPEPAQTNENLEQDVPAERPGSVMPSEEPTEKPHEKPTDPPAMDYYLLGSLYGLGDYPDFSVLFEDPDALSRLKQFYAESHQIVDRVDYHTQSLEYIGNYSGDVKFTSYGEMNAAGDDGQLHTSLKTLMIGKSECKALDDYLESGHNFAEEDFTVSAVTDNIPVLLGHDYLGIYQLGDEFTLSLHMQPLHFTVIGFLKSGTIFEFDHKLPLDQYIVVPFYDISYEPADAVNQFYQQIYYTQKCEGFLRIAADADAEQMFLAVHELAQKYGLLYEVTPVKCKGSEQPIMMGDAALLEAGKVETRTGKC